MCQGAPCLTANILLLATHILSFYLNLITLSPSESLTSSSVKTSVSEKFYFLSLMKLISTSPFFFFDFVFCFSVHCWIFFFIYSSFFCLSSVELLFWYCFPYSFSFCLPCLEILWYLFLACGHLDTSLVFLFHK